MKHEAGLSSRSHILISMLRDKMVTKMERIFDGTETMYRRFVRIDGRRIIRPAAVLRRSQANARHGTPGIDFPSVNICRIHVRVLFAAYDE